MPASQSVPTLVVRSGALEGKRVPLESELTLGRDPDTGLILPDDEVSRKHAVLRPLPGGVEVQDLGSLNGTLVNGRRLSMPARLTEDARLEVGTTALEVVFEAPAGDATRVARPRDAAAAPVDAEGPGQMPAFGSFAPARAARPMRGRPATRLWAGVALTAAVVVADAGALIVYFSQR